MILASIIFFALVAFGLLVLLVPGGWVGERDGENYVDDWEWTDWREEGGENIDAGGSYPPKVNQ